MSVSVADNEAQLNLLHKQRFVLVTNILLLCIAGDQHGS